MPPGFKSRRRTKLIVAVVLLVTACASIVHVVNVRNRQAVLEKVVERMKLAQLKPGQETQFTLNLEDAKSLSPFSPMQILGGHYSGQVWATVAPGGSLKIVIESYDWGHLGSEGFVYSDTPLASDRKGDGWEDIRSPPVNSMSAIDEHWWQMHWSD